MLEKISKPQKIVKKLSRGLAMLTCSSLKEYKT